MYMSVCRWHPGDVLNQQVKWGWGAEMRAEHCCAYLCAGASAEQPLPGHHPCSVRGAGGPAGQPMFCATFLDKASIIFHAFAKRYIK